MELIGYIKELLDFDVVFVVLVDFMCWVILFKLVYGEVFVKEIVELFRIS